MNINTILILTISFIILGIIIYGVYVFFYKQHNQPTSTPTSTSGPTSKPTDPNPTPSPNQSCSTDKDCGPNQKCIYTPNGKFLCQRISFPNENCMIDENCINNQCINGNCQNVSSGNTVCQNGLVILTYPNYQVVNPDLNWSFMYCNNVYARFTNKENADLKDDKNNYYQFIRAMCDSDNNCNTSTTQPSSCTTKYIDCSKNKQDENKYCILDGNCKDGMICYNNACSKDTNKKGQENSSCSTSQECNTGLTCQNNKCKKQSRCDATNKCGKGYYCFNNVCYQVIGPHNPCTMNSMCNSGDCITNPNGPNSCATENAPCKSDKDCPKDILGNIFFCNGNTNKCEKKKENKQSCNTDNECISGHCGKKIGNPKCTDNPCAYFGVATTFQAKLKNEKDLSKCLSFQGGRPQFTTDPNQCSTFNFDGNVGQISVANSDQGYCFNVNPNDKEGDKVEWQPCSNDGSRYFNPCNDNGYINPNGMNLYLSHKDNNIVLEGSGYNDKLRFIF